MMGVVACSGCAHVQATQSWPELVRRLAPNQPVAVTDARGTEVQGKVSGISASALTVNVAGASRRFDSADVRLVRRNGDPLWNGLVVGTAIGAAGALLPDNKCSGQPLVCNDSQIPERVAFFAVVTAAGIGIDVLHRDRTILYRSPQSVMLRVVPFMTPERKGVMLAVGY